MNKIKLSNGVEMPQLGYIPELIQDVLESSEFAEGEAIRSRPHRQTNASRP